MRTIFYAHDPMCSWCWAHRPIWLHITEQLPPGFVARRVLGGLAPDSSEPMPVPMQEHLKETWRRIQTVVPGTEFNFDFWTRCRPRRSTYPACRAVIAAMNQGVEHEERMILAIQRAYYLEARNPSDDDTLIDLARNLDLDSDRFASDLRSQATQAELLRQIALASALGAAGFPSLVVELDNRYARLSLDYTSPAPVLDWLRREVDTLSD